LSDPIEAYIIAVIFQYYNFSHFFCLP